MVTGDCSRKPSGRSVVEQRMSPEHADGRCEEARASHQEIGRSNQKSCPREWFVGCIVHRHQPQASVVTPRPNTSIPIVVDRITVTHQRAGTVDVPFVKTRKPGSVACDGYPFVCVEMRREIAVSVKAVESEITQRKIERSRFRDGGTYTV
ncbi:hypothetical protein CA13_09470 [Planctomycetes bacterium CA13]|uniref:Uncharacterized protein n=1 Tax=Novipirellula herctigrandis TaxID=2527986 RepID=A0A5C5YYI0_9BACT|nr:hypothetical protein CA13_09470 [Planctomycetes bacterium CA13]